MFGFFNKKQKDIALKRSEDTLHDDYETSEHFLQDSAKLGDEKLLHSAMAHHHDIEYAYLFQKTPEYKQLSNKLKK